MVIEKNAQRLSGIELFKIVAITFVIIGHITQTIDHVNPSVSYQDYVVLLGRATDNVQIIILNLFRQLGNLGNDIFFVCSAWFLVDKKEKGTRKAVNLLCQVWTISLLFLFMFLAFSPFRISYVDIIKQIFPTTLSNNWYISCYIIFLFVYPFLNKVINTISQKEHLSVVIFSFLLWVLGDYIKNDLFFPSTLILWATVYFMIAYLKIYCQNITKNKKVGGGISINRSIGIFCTGNYYELYGFVSY